MVSIPQGGKLPSTSCLVVGLEASYDLVDTKGYDLHCKHPTYSSEAVADTLDVDPSLHYHNLSRSSVVSHLARRRKPDSSHQRRKRCPCVATSFFEALLRAMTATKGMVRERVIELDSVSDSCFV